MDILFEVEEQNEYGRSFIGIVEEVPVGHAKIHYRGEHVAELTGIWLVDKESGKPGLREFAEAFFQHLKEQGYIELWLESEYEDDGERLGFQMEDRDISGWYPKYISRREL